MVGSPTRMVSSPPSISRTTVKSSPWPISTLDANMACSMDTHVCKTRGGVPDACADLRPVKHPGEHLGSLACIVVDSLLAENHHVCILTLHDGLEQLGNSQRLQGHSA